MVDLASLYAVCWQSLERTERAMDSERLLAISQLLCPLEGMVDERDRMGIVVGFVRVMTEMMMEKIAFFSIKD